MSGASNSTRGVFMGGLTPTRLNVIDYIEVPSYITDEQEAEA